MKFVDAAAASAALAYPQLITELAAGFAAGCAGPARHHHTIENQGEPDATLLLMPAWSNPGDAERYLGVKLVTVYPGNSAKGLPGLASTYVLYDGETGQQLALIDGNAITVRRTAATAALGARLLARKDAGRLLLLGSGRVASQIPEAMRAVRPIEHVAIWDVNREGAQQLAAQLEQSGFRAEVVDDIESAAGVADLISAATLSTVPLLKRDWVPRGTHVDLIGSFTPSMREVDDALVAASALYVDTADALHESGDLVQPIAAGIISGDRVIGTLAELCRGEVRGRTSADQITLFKSVGSSLADLVAATLVYRSL